MTERIYRRLPFFHYPSKYLLSCMPKFISQFSIYKDELTLYTAPSGILPVLQFLRDHTQTEFRLLMDITAVDYPTKDNRFEVSSSDRLPIHGACGRMRRGPADRGREKTGRATKEQRPDLP